MVVEPADREPASIMDPASGALVAVIKSTQQRPTLQSAEAYLPILRALPHVKVVVGKVLGKALGSGVAVAGRRSVKEIGRAIADDAPASLHAGGVIRPGFSPELDEIQRASRDAKQWVADLEKTERERTGIKSLKVKFNAVFGYFIEITRSNLDNVPDDYVRKQTTVNAERFITPGLKEVEDKILGADERAKRLEYEEFLTAPSCNDTAAANIFY